MTELGLIAPAPLTEEAEARCLSILPSEAHAALAPFSVSRFLGEARACRYYFRDYFRIYYVEKGYVTLSAGEERLRLGWGDIVIVPPDRDHELAPSTADAVIFACSFTIGMIEDILRTQSGTGGTLSRLFNAGSCTVIQPVPADLQLHLVHLMEFLLYEAKREGAFFAVKNCLATLLCVCSELYRAQEAAPEAAEKNSVVYAIHYMKRNYALPLTVDGMAELTRMSRKEFYRRFRRFTGRTMHEFLNGVRIARALEIMASAEGALSLSALAEHCGFADYATFYRNFLKTVGTSPTAYLARHGGASVT